MAWLFLLGLALAQAGERRPVHEGDSVEAIAAELGDPALAERLRQLNQLAADEQPRVGTLLLLPDHDELQEQEGAVLSFRGGVSATLPGRQPVPVSQGMALPQGSTVCTDEGGFATVRLARSMEGLDHDDVSLLSGTCLTMISAVARPGQRSSLVSVSQGSISVRPQDDIPGAVTVETSSGITTGEGGGFRVTLEQEGAMRTEALDAPVSVMGAGQEQRLQAGQGSRVRSGEAPSLPVDMLSPGTPLAPDKGAPLLRPDFSWTPVPNALGYRLEISATPDFSDVVLVEEAGEPAWRPELLFLPYRVQGLWWRVSTFDRVGFLGRACEPSALSIPAGMGP